jgi:hypothetical protein
MSGTVSAEPGVYSWAIVCSCVTGYFQRRSQNLTRNYTQTFGRLHLQCSLQGSIW